MPSFGSSKSVLLPLAILIGAVVLVVTTVALGAWLDGDNGWTQATAGVGLGATVLAAGVLLATSQGWANGTRLSLAAVTVAVIGLGALSLTIVTYVGSAGDTPGGTSEIVNDIEPVVSDEGLALAQQISNNEIQPPGLAHDVGRHPNFDGFMEMDSATILRNTPGGTLLPDEVDLLKEQLAAVRAFAEEHSTTAKATAANFQNFTNDVPFMGEHYLNLGYVGDGVFDPSKPEGLLFSKLGGGEEAESQLVGVWFLLWPGQAGSSETIPPQGFAGNLDLWHEHHGLCTRDGIISENNTREGCLADNGSWTGDLKWMMHVWVWPETADNVDGVFTYLNYGLYEQQNVLGDAGPGLGR